MAYIGEYIWILLTLMLIWSLASFCEIDLQPCFVILSRIYTTERYLRSYFQHLNTDRKISLCKLKSAHLLKPKAILYWILQEWNELWKECQAGKLYHGNRKFNLFCLKVRHLKLFLWWRKADQDYTFHILEVFVDLVCNEILQKLTCSLFCYFSFLSFNLFFHLFTGMLVF